jgi:hypothetical protein
MPLLNERARELIAEYNRIPRCRERYNPAANAVYQARRECGDPFDPRFEHHIIAGLEKFDMGRTMTEGFSTRLHCSLQVIRRKPQIDRWQDCRLSSVDLSAHGSQIVTVYECLARVGTLDPKKQSHVSATKILHWLYPDLFLMLDSKVAGTFRNLFGVKFLKSTQPGYTAEKYLQCLRLAQEDICSFGLEQFRLLELSSPEARIVDKIAWVARQ